MSIDKLIWNLVRCSCGKVIKRIKPKAGVKKRVVIDSGCDYCKKYVRNQKG